MPSFKGELFSRLDPMHKMNVKVVPDTKNPNFVQALDFLCNFRLKIRNLLLLRFDEWNYLIVFEKELWVSPINPRVR